MNASLSEDSVVETALSKKNSDGELNLVVRRSSRIVVLNASLMFVIILFQ